MRGENKNRGCIKCGHTEAEITEIATTGTGLSKLFDIQHNQFKAVSCKNCGYTELYRTKSSLNVLDFFFGRVKGVIDIDKLVTLCTFSDVTEAHIIKGLLESEGIEAYLFDERSAAYTPLTVSGIRLVVKQSNVERAKQILSPRD